MNERIANSGERTLNRNCTRLPATLALAITLLMGVSFVAQAQWLTPPTSTNLLSFSFSGDPYGPYAGAPPKMYTGVSGAGTTITVGDVPGMSKAVILNVPTTAGAGYAYLDQYPADGATPTVYGKHGIYSFDINQLVNSLDAGTAFGSQFSIYGYISGEGWIWGLDLVPATAAGGNFVLETGPYYNLGPVLAPFTTGTVYHVEIDNDYIAGSYDVRIGGNLVASNVLFDAGPEITASRASVNTNYQIKEIFMWNYTAGTGDENITAWTTSITSSRCPNRPHCCWRVLG